jgi:hypothetical protein
VDSLASIFANKFNRNNEALTHIQDLRTFLLLIIEIRNAIEHPHDDRRVDVFDYCLSPNGTIDRPTMAFFKPGQEEARAQITLLMENWSDQLVAVTESIFELLL